MLFPKPVGNTAIESILSNTFCIISSPGHRPYELLSWVSVRPLAFFFFTFKSSLKPLNRIEPNLPEMFIGWSSTRFFFGADLKSNMAARVHNVFSLAEILKSSCQKPPSQLNCDLAGMIIGWSCTKLVNRLPIGNSRWPP